MKKNEVPQDENQELYQNKFGEGMLKYVIDDDDQYTSAISKGWEAEITVLQQAMDDLNTELEEIKAEVRARRMSPIAYYAKLKRMDLSVLAAYAGIWKWKVKRHFNPHTFDKLSEATLTKYAAVFDISVPELKNYQIP